MPLSWSLNTNPLMLAHLPGCCQKLRTADTGEEVMCTSWGRQCPLRIKFFMLRLTPVRSCWDACTGNKVPGQIYFRTMKVFLVLTDLLDTKHVQIPECPAVRMGLALAFHDFIRFSLMFDIFTMTNRWFSLKMYRDEITILKHKSTAPRLSGLKWVLANNSTKGKTQPQRIMLADHNKHACALTLKSHRHRTLVNNGACEMILPKSRAQKWPRWALSEKYLCAW